MPCTVTRTAGSNPALSARKMQPTSDLARLATHNEMTSHRRLDGSPSAPKPFPMAGFRVVSVPTENSWVRILQAIACVSEQVIGLRGERSRSQSSIISEKRDGKFFEDVVLVQRSNSRSWRPDCPITSIEGSRMNP
jgi:hypothetical protein